MSATKVVVKLPPMTGSELFLVEKRIWDIAGSWGPTFGRADKERMVVELPTKTAAQEMRRLLLAAGMAATTR